MGNKRICFISLVNLYLCPYISKYISLIDSEYDVIYWNRHEIEEEIGAKQTFVFNYNMNEGTGSFKKMLGYLKFRKYILDIFKNNNYDRIIVLQTSAGILLHSILKKNYIDKYIVDIRDYTMERNPIFLSIEKSLIKSSAFTVISSKGYESFLPVHDYVLVHNDTLIDDDIIRKFQKRQRNKEVIVISYIGLIRFHEQNKKIILRFKNDNRFLLRFIGKDAFALEDFCAENNITNVELIDRFPPEDTLEFYYETDIIYNLYGNNTPLLDYALSNKLYYAAKLKIPILVCPETYMEQVSVENGFGIVFDVDNSDSVDNLFEVYNSIDWDFLNKKSDLFIEKVEKENTFFDTTIQKFLDCKVGEETQ